jgi:hypothetical protein
MGSVDNVCTALSVSSIFGLPKINKTKRNILNTPQKMQAIISPEHPTPRPNATDHDAMLKVSKPANQNPSELIHPGRVELPVPRSHGLPNVELPETLQLRGEDVPSNQQVSQSL